MSQIQCFAQKALVINDKDELLLIKYSTSISRPDKVNGHYGLPGGRIEFGETPDESIIREVLEETGIDIKPGPCLLPWNWQFKYNGDNIQINAIGRVCLYLRGKLRRLPLNEVMSTLDGCLWIHRDKINDLKIIEDELPNINYLLQNWDFYVDQIRQP